MVHTATGNLIYASHLNASPSLLFTTSLGASMSHSPNGGVGRSKRRFARQLASARCCPRLRLLQCGAFPPELGPALPVPPPLLSSAHPSSSACARLVCFARCTTELARVIGTDLLHGGGPDDDSLELHSRSSLSTRTSLSTTVLYTVKGKYCTVTKAVHCTRT